MVDAILRFRICQFSTALSIVYVLDLPLCVGACVRVPFYSMVTHLCLLIIIRYLISNGMRKRSCSSNMSDSKNHVMVNNISISCSNN